MWFCRVHRHFFGRSFHALPTVLPPAPHSDPLPGIESAVLNLLGCVAETVQPQHLVLAVTLLHLCYQPGLCQACVALVAVDPDHCLEQRIVCAAALTAADGLARGCKCSVRVASPCVAAQCVDHFRREGWPAPACEVLRIGLCRAGVVDDTGQSASQALLAAAALALTLVDDTGQLVSQALPTAAALVLVDDTGQLASQALPTAAALVLVDGTGQLASQALSAAAARPPSDRLQAATNTAQRRPGALRAAVHGRRLLSKLDSVFMALSFAMKKSEALRAVGRAMRSRCCAQRKNARGPRPQSRFLL